MYLVLMLGALCALTLSKPLHVPSVTIKNGTIIGSSSAGVDSFRGIPFAQAPIRDLRLRPPQPLTSSFVTLTATVAAPACPQYTAASPAKLPLSDKVSSVLNNATSAFSSLARELTMPQSEDCLFVDIIRPSVLIPESKLPVVFWIYGGGWQSGSTAALDGTSIVQRSIELGEPVIYVAANYR